MIIGATNHVLALTNLQKAHEGPYWVAVANSFGVTPSAFAHLLVYDPCMEIHMYAGLTIAGQAGSNYVVSYSTNLSNPAGWIPLATNLMGSSNWFYLDMDSPFSPRRFYKAELE